MAQVGGLSQRGRQGRNLSHARRDVGRTVQQQVTLRPWGAAASYGLLLGTFEHVGTGPANRSRVGLAVWPEGCPAEEWSLRQQWRSAQLWLTRTESARTAL